MEINGTIVGVVPAGVSPMMMATMIARASDPTYDGSQYTAEEVMGGYLALIDHVLAIDIPDDETIDQAIAHLQRYYRHRSAHGRNEVASGSGSTP